MPATTKPAAPKLAGFYRIHELALPHGLCGLARSTLYQLAAEGKFPKPVKQGVSSLWPAPAVNAWLRARGALPADTDPATAA